ncbi:NAD(P)/FAD-dependent oxidoreductase [Candidatus Parcubacteria bacterium]|nr:NAD(P)/FAD-dependent oxidoreductase [Candidatus Parcubacteria bacterium]
MSKNKQEKFDLAVIGGGPAGIMAAGRAAELGARVVLIEKNRELGKKLLLTGKGRCNITQAEFDPLKLALKFGRTGKFLLSGFTVFGARETVGFFNKRGLKTKVEQGRRVFPLKGRSIDVLNILTGFLRRYKVEIITCAEVTGIKEKDGSIKEISLKGKGKIIADNYVIATGGKSHPETGSTGMGIGWAKMLGHSITELKPALVPFEIKEKWVKQLQGLALKNVSLSASQGKKKVVRLGEVLFTHFGLSGPIVLDMSREVGELLEQGEVRLLLDLKPALDFEKLDKRIQRDFEKYSNKLYKNALSDLLPQKIIPFVLKASGIKDDKYVREISREERHKLVKLLKGLEMTINRLLPFSKAITTYGGVDLKEIDSKTMKSKLISNLFFAGEIINLDGPTGGYNLQLCWTTGRVAGENAAKVL